MPTLDIAEAQVLVDYFDDPNELRWHHRILFQQGEGSRWIWATPDHEVEVADLDRHRVLPLGRAAPFPPNRAHEIYAFDPIEEEELANLRTQALALARLVGFPKAAAAGAAAGGVDMSWRVSDPSHESFDSEVPDAAFASPDDTVVRGQRALVLIDAEWTCAELVPNADAAQWRRSKLCGRHRDERLAGDTIDMHGVRRVGFADAIAEQREVTVTGWMHSGPKAALEQAQSILSAGQTFPQHHLDWRSKSGISERSAVCRAHKDWTDLLHMMWCVDELNCSALSSFEFAARKVVQLETATRRNPRQPDFEGLELMSSHTLDESGAAATAKFNEWISQRQRDEAQVLKQGRLLREERAAECRKQQLEKDGGGGGAGAKRKVKPGDKPGGDE